MTLLLLLLIIVGLSAGGSLYLVVREGRGPLAPPASHVVDSRFLPPAARLTR